MKNERGNEYDNKYLRLSIYKFIEDIIERKITDKEHDELKEILSAWQGDVAQKATKELSAIKSIVLQKQPHLLNNLKI